MRLITFIFTLLVTNLCLANMASPYEDGSTTGTPFTNQHVDILKENLSIVLDGNFKEAHYKISYFIDVKQEGIRVPLLFLAENFERDFKVQIDSQTLELKRVDSGFISENFDYFLNDEQRVMIWWNRNDGRSAHIQDLKYFEVDLPVGKHVIKVEYVGESWMSKKDWVKEYSYRYILSPAKYWKSFGELNLSIDASKYKGEISTNLRQPDEGDLQEIATWHFDSLPAEIVKIDYNPEITDKAKFLINLGPLNLALIFGIFLALIHFVGIWRYRKKSTARISWPAIIGSFIVVGAFVFAWIFAYSFIDNEIGEGASHYHGYVEVGIVFLAPFILVGYLIVALLFDFLLKKVKK